MNEGLKVILRVMTSTRVLFISGSIGLGHAVRDLASAGQLRRLSPGGMMG